MILQGIVVECRASAIGDEERRGRCGVPKRVGQNLLGTPPPIRRIEPQLVVPDRPANAQAPVIDLFHGWRRRDAGGAQLWRDVGALEGIVRVVSNEVNAKLISTFS